MEAWPATNSFAWFLLGSLFSHSDNCVQRRWQISKMGHSGGSCLGRGNCCRCGPGLWRQESIDKWQQQQRWLQRRSHGYSNETTDDVLRKTFPTEQRQWLKTRFSRINAAMNEIVLMNNCKLLIVLIVIRCDSYFSHGCFYISLNSFTIILYYHMNFNCLLLHFQV